MPATYEPIASTTLGSAASSVTFSDIAGTWTDLLLVTNTKLAAQTGNGPHVRVNSDTGSNYSRTIVYGDPDGAASDRTSSATSWLNLLNAGTSDWSTSITHFMSYSNTNVYKTVLGGYAYLAVNVTRAVGLWRSTSAITSITVTDLESNNFVAGSTFSLFGVKAA